MRLKSERTINLGIIAPDRKKVKERAEDIQILVDLLRIQGSWDRLLTSICEQAQRLNPSVTNAEVAGTIITHLRSCFQFVNADPTTAAAIEHYLSQESVRTQLAEETVEHHQMYTR